MPFELLADLIVLLHLAFILFAVFGGWLVLLRRGFMWWHLPTAAWAALIEFADWPCPLTHVENRLRVLAGRGGYHGGFVNHYIMPVVYPAGLTRSSQVVLGVLVLAVNVLAYGAVWAAHSRRLASRGRV